MKRTQHERKMNREIFLLCILNFTYRKSVLMIRKRRPLGLSQVYFQKKMSGWKVLDFSYRLFYGPSSLKCHCTKTHLDIHREVQKTLSGDDNICSTIIFQAFKGFFLTFHMSPDLWFQATVIILSPPLKTDALGCFTFFIPYYRKNKYNCSCLKHSFSQ